MSLITFGNRGQALTNTNYWNHELAQAGYLFLSWNAGAARLLVPDSQKPMLREMKSVKYVVLSRGPLLVNGRGVIEGLELLFEDESNNPLVLMMEMEQSALIPSDLAQGANFTLIVYTRGGEKLRLPGKFRRVSSIPCLKHW